MHVTVRIYNLGLFTLRIHQAVWYNGKAQDSHLGSTGFELQQAYSLFRVFHQSLQVNYGEVHRLGHTIFLFNPSQFHQAS
jgi:hypothetical protein